MNINIKVDWLALLRFSAFVVALLWLNFVVNLPWDWKFHIPNSLALYVKGSTILGCTTLLTFALTGLGFGEEEKSEVS